MAMPTNAFQTFSTKITLWDSTWIFTQERITSNARQSTTTNFAGRHLRTTIAGATSMISGGSSSELRCLRQTTSARRTMARSGRTIGVVTQNGHVKTERIGMDASTQTLAKSIRALQVQTRNLPMRSHPLLHSNQHHDTNVHNGEQASPT